MKNPRLVTYRGAVMRLGSAIRLSGIRINSDTVWRRVQLGWTFERAIETQVRKKDHYRRVEGTSRQRSQEIIAAVLSEHKLHRDDFFSRSRVSYVVDARKDAAKRLFDIGLTSKQVASILKRDHTTVLSYFDKHKKLRQSAYSELQVLSKLAPEAKEIVVAYAKAEGVRPEMIIAQWVGERARFEAEQRARAAA